MSDHPRFPFDITLAEHNADQLRDYLASDRCTQFSRPRARAALEQCLAWLEDHRQDVA